MMMPFTVEMSRPITIPVLLSGISPLLKFSLVEGLVPFNPLTFPEEVTKIPVDDAPGNC